MKVIDFTTIQKYLTYLQGLASKVNIPYVNNITLDVKAVNIIYQVLDFPLR